MEWSVYEVSEGCEHSGDPKEVEDYLVDLLKNLELYAPSPYDCSKPVKYAGRGRALCGRHFEEIKFRSSVRWALFDSECSV